MNASIIRRTRRISWAPSGWLVSGVSRGVETELLTLTCSDDFVAIRVAFANIERMPYKVEKIIVSASSTLGDYVNPTGDVSWVLLTSANRGADGDAVVTYSGAPTSVDVGPAGWNAQTGCDNLASWTWTDWVPLRSVERADEPGGPRVVMIRALFAPECRHTRPNGGFAEYNASQSIHSGFAYVAGHVPIDAVSRPEKLPSAAAGLGHANAPVSCVQFLTVRPGIVGVTTGDSHHQGTGSTSQFHNYLLQATVKVGSRHVEKIPFGYWNAAQGGMESTQFFPALTTILPAAEPSFVVLPGWTYNDRSGDIHADGPAVDGFFARLLLTAERCRQAGAMPIFLTPFPRDPGGMKERQVVPWGHLRTAILALGEAGALVIDSTKLLGHMSNGTYDGTYLPAYTDDGAHPNDAGHAVIAVELSAILQRLVELS